MNKSDMSKIAVPEYIEVVVTFIITYNLELVTNIFLHFESEHIHNMMWKPILNL